MVDEITRHEQFLRGDARYVSARQNPHKTGQAFETTYRGAPLTSRFVWLVIFATLVSVGVTGWTLANDPDLLMPKRGAQR